MDSITSDSKEDLKEDLKILEDPKDSITEYPKKDLITEGPIEDPITEDPKQSTNSK